MHGWKEFRDDIVVRKHFWQLKDFRLFQGGRWHLASIIIDDDVARDLVDPTFEFLHLFQRPDMLVDLQKDILQQILGHSFIVYPLTNKLVQRHMKGLPDLFCHDRHRQHPSSLNTGWSFFQKDAEQFLSPASSKVQEVKRRMQHP